MKIRKRPADAVAGDRQLSACLLGPAHGRNWVVRRMAAFLNSLRAALAGLPPLDLHLSPCRSRSAKPQYGREID